MRKFHLLIAVVAVGPIIASIEANAVTRSWPGAAPCAATLQACIDASAAADTVLIASELPIAENLNLPRSITLEGIDFALHPAQLLAGFGISGTSSGSAAYNVAIRNIALGNARIELNHLSTGTANIEIRRVSMLSTASTNIAGIRVQANPGSGTATIRIADNRLKVATPGLFDAALQVSLFGNNGSVMVDFNHIESVGDADGWGIFADIVAGSTPTVTVINNEVRGRYGRAAIGISEGLFSSTPSTVTARVIGNAVVGRARQGTGIMQVINNGSINTQTINNTAVGNVYGILFSRWSGSAGSGSIGGPVENNLIAYNSRGLSINPEFQPPLAENYNLLFANDLNAYTPGAFDVTLDPKLISLTNVRLRDDTSWAANVGRSTANTVYTATGLGLVDADGLRREKFNRIDIGAYEYGDVSVRARADVTSGNYFIVDHPLLNLRSRLNLFATTRAASLLTAQPIGVWYSSTTWRIFNQNLAAMPTGMEFNLFVPQETDGTFVHTATVGNLSGHFTTIDQPDLNNTPNKIVLATSNWNPESLPGVYNNHTTSMGYFPPSWFVLNNDFGAMSVGAAFNIYSQDPSPNAYMHTATNLNSFAAVSYLDHPLLNATPCAQVNLTPRTGLHGDNAFLVGYAEGAQRWAIANANNVAMADGAEFNVVIDAAQVAACAGVLFGDGFED